MADILARNPKLDDVIRKAANKLGENHGLTRDNHGAMIDNQGNSTRYVGSHGQHPSKVNQPRKKTSARDGWHRILNELEEGNEYYDELEEDCGELGEDCGRRHEDEEMEEATGSGSSGAYVGPIFGNVKENVKETNQILESVMRNEVSKIINESQLLMEKPKSCAEQGKSGRCRKSGWGGHSVSGCYRDTADGGCECEAGWKTDCGPTSGLVRGDNDITTHGKGSGFKTPQGTSDRLERFERRQMNEQEELEELSLCWDWCFAHGGTCESKYGPCNIPDSGSFDSVADIPKGGVKGSGFKTPQGTSDRLERFERRQMKESLKNRLTRNILNESYAEPIYEIEFDDSKNLLMEKPQYCWWRTGRDVGDGACARGLSDVPDSECQNRRECLAPDGESYLEATGDCPEIDCCARDQACGIGCECIDCNCQPSSGRSDYEYDRDRIYEIEFDDSKNLLQEKDYFTGKLKWEKPTKLPGDPKNTPGINLTKKVLNKAKSETSSHLKQIDKKIKDYLDFEGNSHPEFPHQNNSKTDYKSPMYRNSTEDEEFIDDFRGMGLEDANGVDTLDRIGDYLNGSSQTGNAQTSKDGKALGNVVPNKVGEKVLKKVKRKKARIAKQKSKMTNLRGYTPDVQQVVKESTKIKHLFEYNEKTQ